MTMVTNPRAKNLRSDETLDSLCWCGTSVVRVPRADVRAGRTRTCKRQACKKIAWRAALGLPPDYEPGLTTAVD